MPLLLLLLQSLLFQGFPHSSLIYDKTTAEITKYDKENQSLVPKGNLATTKLHKCVFASVWLQIPS